MNTDTTQDILITGLPRSGTTLTCHLLNKVPNSVALHEPMSPNQLEGLETTELLGTIAQFFAAQRDQILTKGTATSKAWNGAVPPNPRGDADAQGRRTTILNGTEIAVSNVSSSTFHLYIKHPAFFTAALPVLIGRFSCFAIVRNPLAVLLSWRTAGMAVSDGRMPAAEQFDPRLVTLLNAEPDVLNRQLILLDYCFSQYRRFLPSRIIWYEDIIRSGGKALSLINPAANQLDEPLRSRNMLGIQTDPAAKEIGMRLLESESSCWSFYEKVNVEALLLSQ
ncbi:hypothetical protein P775_01415 [Puniceibacterium antarcticum]|uniref:Uncharacterized protein n=1 Tax=Puniceibacterium antarcticum TaxID=1206336 RepID=A0A2G8RKF7_9RHOB|nr:sulfotransferase domain-containing protein [Puniceibacterium antarcticum]PIL21983.1 hypothetical protein P775_01415 [Puniceibacterium antarcticum]